MRRLPYILIVSVFLFSQNCSHEFLSKFNRTAHVQQPSLKTIAEETDRSKETGQAEEKSSLNPDSNLLSFILKYRFELLLVLLLLLLLIRYRGQKKKKDINLDESDLALIGVASDALSDLQYRIKKKTKARIISLPTKKNPKKFNGNDSSIIHP